MRGLDSFGITGSEVDSVLSELFIRCNVKAMVNIYTFCDAITLNLTPEPIWSTGTWRTPYEHASLLTITSTLTPLWTLVSSHPRLAHMVAENGAPIKIEPYPGPRTQTSTWHAAAGWSDLFYELQITRNSAANPEIAYVHAGRTDDVIRLSCNEKINTSEVELALSAAIRAKFDGLTGWELDIVQVFGTNRPHTALVVQLRRTEAETGASSPERVVGGIREAVEGVNKEPKLIKEVQIDAYRRGLVVTESGELLGEGKYERIFEGTQPILSTTHKHAVQRWINVQTFEPWLEQVCETID
ncbi:hypothetical protein FRC10_005517 [Ceratobasidium sp. 414]|nr:hypothetical protein FRC10_005517 [Ceratobasidium sp. 414]